MTTTWLLTHVFPVVAFFLLASAAAWLAPKVKDRLSPTQPQDPGDDDREASGADEPYGDELDAMKRSEKELAAIAAELELNILDDEQRAWAVDALDLRLMVAEDIDHFGQRVSAIIDDFAPGWWDETVVVPLPSFGAVHALIDDTGEYAAVTG